VGKVTTFKDEGCCEVECIHYK